MLGELSKGCRTTWRVLPGSDGCPGAHASPGVFSACISRGLFLLPWSTGAARGVLPMKLRWDGGDGGTNVSVDIMEGMRAACLLHGHTQGCT